MVRRRVAPSRTMRARLWPSFETAAPRPPQRSDRVVQRNKKMPAIARRHSCLIAMKSALLHQRADALVQRDESFIRRDGGDQLVVIPGIFRLFGLLDLEQIGG